MFSIAPAYEHVHMQMRGAVIVCSDMDLLTRVQIPALPLIDLYSNLGQVMYYRPSKPFILSKLMNLHTMHWHIASMGWALNP